MISESKFSFLSFVIHYSYRRLCSTSDQNSEDIVQAQILPSSYIFKRVSLLSFLCALLTRITDDSCCSSIEASEEKNDHAVFVPCDCDYMSKYN